MVRIFSIIVFIIFCLCVPETLYARAVYRQKRSAILKAIEEEVDLSDETKESLRKKFGNPIKRIKKETPEGVEERWLYLPYKTGTKKIEIVFLNDKVVNFVYK